jgi:hypothetical protein
MRSAELTPVAPIPSLNSFVRLTTKILNFFLSKMVILFSDQARHEAEAHAPFLACRNKSFILRFASTSYKTCNKLDRAGSCL